MTISELKKDAKEKLKSNLSSAICISIAYSLFVFLLSFLASILATVLKNQVTTFILQVLLAIISLPLTFGFLVSMIKLYRGEKVGYFSFVSTGFSNIYNAWKVLGRTLLKLLVPLILIIITYIVLAFAIASIIVAGIIAGSFEEISLTFPLIAIALFVASYVFAMVKSLYYVLGNYILCDNPELTGKEIVEKSADLMIGNRMKYFLLNLSFIGWILLIIMIFIALLFGLPALGVSNEYLIKIIPVVVTFALSLILSCYIRFSTISFYEDLNGVVPSNPVNSDNPSSTDSTPNEPIKEASSDENTVE